MGQTLIDYRCPVCSWTGDEVSVDTVPLCPRCDHGLVSYEVTLHD